MLRVLCLTLPSLAVAILAYAFLVVGVERPVVAARVFAGPTAPHASQVNVHIQVFEVFQGAEQTVSQHAITVKLMDGSPVPPLLWSGQTNDLGFTEAQFLVPRSFLLKNAELIVSHRASTDLMPSVLVRGQLPERLPTWTATAVESPVVPGQASGPYLIQVGLVRGALAVPFQGAIELRVTQAGKEAPAITLELKLVGASFIQANGQPNPTSTATSVTTDQRGISVIEILPQSHAIELTIASKANTLIDSSRWFGALPIIPGAMLASVDGTHLKVHSPVVRKQAFIRFVSRTERLGALSLSLLEDKEGTTSGSTSMPKNIVDRLSKNEPVWAVLSSDPHSLSGGSVGWSLLTPQLAASTTFTPPDSKIMDGAIAVQHVELVRRSTGRNNGLLGALGVLILFGIVFVQRLRKAPTRSI